MASNFLMHEKIWFDKFKYDDAERKYYEQMNGPICSPSSQQVRHLATSSGGEQRASVLWEIAECFWHGQKGKRGFVLTCMLMLSQTRC